MIQEGEVPIRALAVSDRTSADPRVGGPPTDHAPRRATKNSGSE
jgi:hypothetical protein